MLFLGVRMKIWAFLNYVTEKANWGEELSIL